MRRALAVAICLGATACWDFDAAVNKCKENPALCNPGGAGGGNVAVGEAAVSCVDGVDNDDDGKIDCADTDCEGITCRAQNGACDRGEVCTAGVCPPDGLELAAHPCRPAAGSCDVTDVCDGLSPACPIDQLVARDTQCRDAGALCEQLATCDGVSPLCPPNGILGAGAPCRPKGGDCDIAETCNGTSRDCPPDRVVAQGVACRPAVDGGCDLDELCQGDAGACPADVVVDAGIPCRPRSGSCDTPEVCTGTALCPRDVSACDAGLYCNAGSDQCEPQRDAGVQCGADNECGSGFCAQSVCCDAACGSPCGACNLPGRLGTCSPLLASMVCRQQAGACDVPELCTGTALACPADVRVDAGTECRQASDLCDVPEVCDGTASCPADVLAGSSVVCRPDAGLCDLADICNGTSAACPDRLVDAGTQCRSTQGNACDVAEACDGLTASCPTDLFRNPGTTCGAASCTMGQFTATPTCASGGVCATPAPVSCLGYACNGAACRISCLNDTECVSSHGCDGGTCVPKPGVGAPCTTGSCTPGLTCIDGVCCQDSTCAGPCVACNLPGALGTCSPRQAGLDPEGGCGQYTCDGTGQCHGDCAGQPTCSDFCDSEDYCSDAGTCVPKKPNGANACSASCECTNGNCHDGYCCNQPCGSPCQRCDATPGTCTNQPSGQDPEGGCGLYVCGSSGACLTNCTGQQACGTACKASAYCNGASCVPDLTGPTACASGPNGQCQCASCQTYYRDVDKDLYGNINVFASFCALPPDAGWLNSVGILGFDCCDTDGAARPNQMTFFSAPRTCGGYDYNCNGSDEVEDPTMFGCEEEGLNCTDEPFVCFDTPGWQGATALCGETKIRYTACNATHVCGGACTGCNQCNPTVLQMPMRTQKCR